MKFQKKCCSSSVWRHKKQYIDYFYSSSTDRNVYIDALNFQVPFLRVLRVKFIKYCLAICHSHVALLLIELNHDNHEV